MPTTEQDPERARLQRAAMKPPEWTNESDWVGLLMGLAAVIGVIALIVGGLHVYLRLVN